MELLVYPCAYYASAYRSIAMVSTYMPIAMVGASRISTMYVSRNLPRGLLYVHYMATIWLLYGCLMCLPGDFLFTQQPISTNAVLLQ